MKHDMTHAWHNLRLPPRNSIIINNSNNNNNGNSNSNNGNGNLVTSTAAGAMTSSSSKIEVYQESYTLGPLLPDSSYEAKVSAKNVFGWSDSSNIFQFYTQGKGNKKQQPIYIHLPLGVVHPIRHLCDII